MTDSEAAITAICNRVLQARVQELRIELNKAAEIIRRHNIRDADAVELCRTAPKCLTCTHWRGDVDYDGICDVSGEVTPKNDFCDEYDC